FKSSLLRLRFSWCWRIKKFEVFRKRLSLGSRGGGSGSSFDPQCPVESVRLCGGVSDMVSGCRNECAFGRIFSVFDLNIKVEICECCIVLVLDHNWAYHFHVIGAQRANRHSLFLVWVKLSAPPKRDGSVYFMYVSSDSSELLRFQIRFDSVVKHFKWNKYARNCNLLQLKPSTECEKYNRCGNYSVCDERKEFNFGKCSCINGFDLNVREGEFRELRGIKFPEFGSVIFLSNSEACKDVCVRDCSCNAYAFFRGVEHGGQSINIRIAESELGGKGNSKNPESIATAPCHLPFDLIEICFSSSFKLVFKVVSSATSPYPEVAYLSAILWRKKDFSVFEKEENKDYSVTSSSSTIQVLVSDLLDTSELTIFTFNSVASANRKISLKKTSLDRANLVLCIRYRLLRIYGYPRTQTNKNGQSTFVYLDYLSPDLGHQLSLVGPEKVSIDSNIGVSIDTPFSLSIDATNELSRSTFLPGSVTHRFDVFTRLK
ncbi:hypothetical protein IGI04_019326, partial [Brassica rapa subsp. trilocularis]